MRLLTWMERCRFGARYHSNSIYRGYREDRAADLHRSSSQRLLVFFSSVVRIVANRTVNVDLFVTHWDIPVLPIANPIIGCALCPNLCPLLRSTGCAT